MKPADVVLDVAMTPADAIARLQGSIGRRERRLFGLLKTTNEYDGWTTADGFEIWERQQRAVHAIGLVRAVAGGSRVELRFVLPRSTWVLTVVFVALCIFIGVGLATSPPDPSLSPVELGAMVLGAAVLTTGFVYAARRQRAGLAAFVASLFSDGARGHPSGLAGDEPR